MNFLFFLLRRALFPEKGNLLSLALWISVLGVVLGIVQLMIVLSVMTGFQELFKNNYTRITSELVVVPKGNRFDRESFRAKLNAVPGIRATTPFELAQGMVIKEGVGGVVLEGVDLKSSIEVTPWKEVWIAEPSFEAQRKDSYWMWLGVQLAQKLKARQGDRVTLLIAEGARKKTIPFVVTAITKFGIYDHDLRYVRIDLAVLEDLFNRHSIEPMYKCKLSSNSEVGRVANRVREALGPSVSIKTWKDINQNIFLAVEHQKRMLFLILEIVIALAAMNVVNLLMMSSHQRRRDVAILRAMGMRVQQVFFFFLLQGTVVAIFGLMGGVTMGYAVCWAVSKFQPAHLLSESIYNVSQLPLRIDLPDLGLVCFVAVVLCVIFSVVPAMRAALSHPVKALRYE